MGFADEAASACRASAAVRGPIADGSNSPDFSWMRVTADDRILDQYGPYQACTGAVCDVPYLVKWKQYEDSAGRAEVTYHMRYTASASSQTATLSLYVGGNSASTSFAARF